MIDFKKKIKQKSVKQSDSPIDIYLGLDRTNLAGPLRSSQEKVLKEWYEKRSSDRDVVIKLHTGEGKTLIGLLILMTKLNKGEGPCVYVCPNIYLADQVCKEASKFGIPICTIGENKQLPIEFTSGKRILVTHVQKIFNGKTIFKIGNLSEKIGAVVLDDAHACLDAIRDAFIISIKRNSNKGLYEKILELFEDDLMEQGEGSLWDIKNNENYESVMMIPYWAWVDKKSQMLEILASNEDKSEITFVWPLIKDNLQSCQAFINGKEIQISPVVTPINKFGSFVNAKNRILMSATTQDDSFFVKTLGISVDAIKNPITNETLKWSGEKMILIPSLINPEFTRDAVIEHFGKLKYKFGVVALTPTKRKQDDYGECDCILVDRSNIYDEIYNLRQGIYGTDGKGKIRVLTNRYDGIDLPDNACRILILDSLPFLSNMGDMYEERARGESRLIQKKIAQKIEQGLGRSVRGEKDYCCVIIIGSELVSFIRSSATRNFFSVQTQKQIEIGLQMTEWIKEDENDVTMNSIVTLINQCLKRDEGWKEYYEDEMNGIEIIQNTRDEEFTILLSEQKAEQMFIQKRYDEAANIIQKIIDSMENKNDRGWYLQLKAYYKYFSSKLESQRLQKSAFQNNYEMLKPQEGIEYNKIENINLNRIQNIIENVQKFKVYEELMLEVNKMCECLSFGIEADKFESAIQELGTMLGYASQRPDKYIRKGPDNLWALGENSYIMIECKSEVSKERREIYKSEVGQMENHCGWFDKEYKDAKVLRIMIIPTVHIAYDADFTHDVRIMSKENLKALKKNVISFFKELKDYDLCGLEEHFIHKILKTHKLDNCSILEAYTVVPKKR